MIQARPDPFGGHLPGHPVADGPRCGPDCGRPVAPQIEPSLRRLRCAHTASALAVKAEGAVVIVECWILARLRNRKFLSIETPNVAIAELLDDLIAQTMRPVKRSRRDLFEEIGRHAPRPLPDTPFEYAEWKRAKELPEYHIEVLHGFHSVPLRVIGRQVDVQLILRLIEFFPFT